MSTENKKSGISTILLLLLAKSAKLLKLTKLFKVAKPLVLIISMSISTILYTFMMGPWLALLFVFLLLVHEMGHVVAMRIKGFETPTPVFIPFLGAAIFVPKFNNRDEEAFIGYGGPLLGTIGTILVFVIWMLLPDKNTPTAHILLVGSYISTQLNLFNLLPISPLDGGRITQATGKWFKYVGIIALAVFSVFFREPVILYIWILVLFDFSLLPINLRAVLIPCCWLTMSILMSLGYGDQPTIINIFDCVITFPFVFISITKAMDSEIIEETDLRLELPKNQKMKWFILYLGLLFFLSLLLIFQLHLLPKLK